MVEYGIVGCIRVWHAGVRWSRILNDMAVKGVVGCSRV